MRSRRRVLRPWLVVAALLFAPVLAFAAKDPLPSWNDGAAKQADEVFKFVATFKDFPPRSFPPSFNPANLLEEKLREIQAGRKLRSAFPMLVEEAEKGKQSP